MSHNNTKFLILLGNLMPIFIGRILLHLFIKLASLRYADLTICTATPGVADFLTSPTEKKAPTPKHRRDKSTI